LNFDYLDTFILDKIATILYNNVMKDLSERILCEESASIKLSETARLKRESGHKVISFALGEPIEDAPSVALDAAKIAIDNKQTKYTVTQGAVQSREAICKWIEFCTGLKYTADQIVISNGAKHSIFNTVLSIVDIGDEVIIPSPYWLSYPHIVKAAGGEPIIVDTSKTGFKLTAGALEREIGKKTKLVIINTPNNPSGVVYSKKELEELAEIIIEEDLYVLADEIYSNFVYDGKHHSVATIDGLRERTVLIGGMSKDFAMTGIRIGWSASNLEIAKAATIMQSHTTSCANSIAQEMTRAVLQDPSNAALFLKGLQKDYDEHRLLLMDGLDKMSMDYVIPKGALYILVSIKQFLDASIHGTVIDGTDTFVKLLLDIAGIVVVPCEPFGIDNYIRLSYTISKKDIVEGLKRLEKFVLSIGVNQ